MARWKKFDKGYAKKKAIKEFEDTIEMAELKALSKASLERPLTNKEYKRMMELKRKQMGSLIKKKLRAGEFSVFGGG